MSYDDNNPAYFIDTTDIADFDASQNTGGSLPPVGVYADTPMMIVDIGTSESKNKNTMLELTFQFLDGAHKNGKFKLFFNTMHEKLETVQIAKKQLVNIAGAIENIKHYGNQGVKINDRARFFNKPFIATLTVTETDSTQEKGKKFKNGALSGHTPVNGWKEQPMQPNQGGHQAPQTGYNPQPQGGGYQQPQGGGYQQPQQPVYTQPAGQPNYNNQPPAQPGYNATPPGGYAPQPNYTQPGQPPVGTVPGKTGPSWAG